MATTPNKFLDQPARGSNVGVWDTPVNANTGIIDNSFGGVASIGLTNSNVTLSGAQYQNVFIVFTGTLSANVAITFPNVGSFYTIQNRCAGSSAFTITLQTTVAGSQVIGCPPYEPFDIMTDGSNVKFRNFGRVGEAINTLYSSNPAWNTACTIPPYLNADGTTFSSATYPALATILGSTTLPDLRGRVWATLDQSAGRMTSSGGGIDGSTRLSAGGVQNITLGSANLPPIAVTGNQGSILQVSGGAVTVASGTGVQVYPTGSLTGITPTAASTQTSSGTAALFNMPPTCVGGLTMIRAA